MRAKNVGYRSLDDLHGERERIAWYWKVLARISSWMLLSGFLVLPTTFDSDPQLRFSRSVLTVIVVTFLTVGYGLTGLLSFAVPSIVFRHDSIFLPSASCAAFGFVACVWALVTSQRYSAATPSSSITLALSIVSTCFYGGLALYTGRRIKQSTRRPVWPAHIAWHDHAWQDPHYQQSYVTSPYLAAPRTSMGPEGGGMYPHSVPVMSEDEMVSHQMAKLLRKTDPGPSPDATQSTFRLEWPPGGDMDDENVGKKMRSRTFSGSAWLLPPGQGSSKHARNRSEGTGNGGSSAWSKIGRMVGGGDRGRTASRTGGTQERAVSREERRREIELGHM